MSVSTGLELAFYGFILAWLLNEPTRNYSALYLCSQLSNNCIPVQQSNNEKYGLIQWWLPTILHHSPRARNPCSSCPASCCSICNVSATATYSAVSILPRGMSYSSFHASNLCIQTFQLYLQKVVQLTDIPTFAILGECLLIRTKILRVNREVFEFLTRCLFNRCLLFGPCFVLRLKNL